MIDLHCHILPGIDDGSRSLDMSLDELERNHILRALAYNHGNKTKTAQSLGVTIKTLYNKLHRYGILKPQDTTAAEEVVN